MSQSTHPLVSSGVKGENLRLGDVAIAPEVIVRIPARLAAHYRIVPVALENDRLVIAASSAADAGLFDELTAFLDVPIRLISASEPDIEEAIRTYYGIGAETIEKMMDAVNPSESESSLETIDESDAEASISRFLNQILLQAWRDRASDIHIEPVGDDLKIRCRIDGILYDARVPANLRHFKDALNSRIKILSRLNIAERRRPQDGRFKVRFQDVDLDLRASFLPTPAGESVVLRILQTTRLYKLPDLGFAAPELDLLKRLIHRPNGIIFLTGPTGSGKTSTLYSCLAEVHNGRNKIITIEDPVEYQIPGLIQLQVNPAIGLTFANGLRSMLRHDPDIMMVGEVRDRETAEIAVQTALTGHLVFSTLHTNDAAGAVTRLIDMGIEPYLIASTVKCFIAQRLLRMICPSCKTRRESGENSDVIQAWMKAAGDVVKPEIFYGRGCDQCYATGYRGRAAIYEFLPMTSGLHELIMRKAASEEMTRLAVREGMTTLAQAGWAKIKAGLTTPEEVLRVTQEGL